MTADRESPWESKLLKPAEQSYWQAYLDSLAPDERPRDGKVEAAHAGNREITDGLLQLYLCGKKTAGSSIAEDFLSAGDPLPKAGNHWIFLNSRDEPSCILRTERVVFHKFKDVPAEVAVAEGEGDLTLEYWRRVHAALYLPHLPEWGVAHIDEATVVTEFFRLVYKSEKNRGEDEP